MLPMVALECSFDGEQLKVASPFRGPSLPCQQSFRRRIGFILEFEKAEPERGIGERQGRRGAALTAAIARVLSAPDGTITLMIGALRTCSIGAAARDARIGAVNPTPIIAAANSHFDTVVGWVASLSN